MFEAVPGDDAGDVSFAALHGLYWLTVNLAAEQRLPIVVDDLHWCDRTSLRFLAYLGCAWSRASSPTRAWRS